MSAKEAYEVIETLGTGSFGTVNKVRRRDTGQILVWKEINFGKMTEREKAQVVAEVNILRGLSCPFVVKYFDRIIDKSQLRLYIVMEYCCGGDLARVIKNCKTKKCNLEESLIWKVFAQCLVALKDCHRHTEGPHNDLKPILHRDIKPANILLDSNNNIKLGDFGLSKELSSQSKMAQTNVGTPFYMAPEVMNDRPYDERSDIWSLGCLLYELAALRPPFDATNAVALGMKINQGKFQRIPNKYSDALADSIGLMLRVDHRRRPRVEELEVIPFLQPFIQAARAIVSREKQGQQERDKEKVEAVRQLHSIAGAGSIEIISVTAAQLVLAERERELQMSLASLRAREAALVARESTVTAREEAIRREEGRLELVAKKLGVVQAQGHDREPLVLGKERDQENNRIVGMVVDPPDNTRYANIEGSFVRIAEPRGSVGSLTFAIHCDDPTSTIAALGHRQHSRTGKETGGISVSRPEAPVSLLKEGGVVSVVDLSAGVRRAKELLAGGITSNAPTTIHFKRPAPAPPSGPPPQQFQHHEGNKENIGQIGNNLCGGQEGGSLITSPFKRARP